MGRSKRVTATVLLATVIAVSGALAAGAAVPVKSVKGPKIKRYDACTILSPRQVANVFGGPARAKIPALGKNVCDYPIGVDPKTLPGGTLSAARVFPTVFVPQPDANAAVEDSHAIDALSNNQLADVNKLGINAYINITKGVLVVAANKHYAFSLTWFPASVISASITDRDTKKLIKLAKDIIKRAPR